MQGIGLIAKRHRVSWQPRALCGEREAFIGKQEVRLQGGERYGWRMCRGRVDWPRYRSDSRDRCKQERQNEEYCKKEHNRLLILTVKVDLGERIATLFRYLCYSFTNHPITFLRCRRFWRTTSIPHNAEDSHRPPPHWISPRNRPETFP